MSSATGIGMETEFSIEVRDFFDEDTPLSYKYSYYFDD